MAVAIPHHTSRSPRVVHQETQPFDPALLRYEEGLDELTGMAGEFLKTRTPKLLSGVEKQECRREEHMRIRKCYEKSYEASISLVIG